MRKPLTDINTGGYAPKPRTRPGPIDQGNRGVAKVNVEQAEQKGKSNMTTTVNKTWNGANT